ncbi:Na+/H+ antiporter NhaC family protein [Aciduricibacillus chroicocephali]|uniref:Na+/H+ antiporter NhaC family protein n=1 Tax=Aciduricibacillus chroicocephali TaxID=3054939 RepID=A0ABY9KVX2_9BACI|nr:Na+/H+ antiporter NhaC family protein [Bacillaceae bacterium 44XB]
MDTQEILSLLPAVIMLVLVLATRKVLLSLGTGIIAGALILNDFSILGTLKEIWKDFANIFYTEGAVNSGNLLLLAFLLLLGIMTALLAASGGSLAFGEWMIRRVKTRAGAQLMTVLLGIIIFIDDYFNALAVGQVARPLTDRHRVSRAKLAYYIDSTAAPVTVISPISSWGAFIIGILGSIFAANGIRDMKPLTSFVEMIPYNFYALTALLLVFLTALFSMDLGPMRKHEKRAMETGQLIDPDPKKAKVAGDLSSTFEPHEEGRVRHLLVPIITLIAVTVIMMIYTGFKASGSNPTVLTIFAETNVNLSLFSGGVVAVIVGFALHFTQKAPRANGGKILWEGIKTMLPAIYILLLAWIVGSIISDLKTGEILANYVQQSTLKPTMLPLVFFVISGIMALATGTSWGTFGIMLAIGAEVVLKVDINLLLPTLSAILAGSVFGDHCSPISDSTILSSTGAGANHIDHVMTQFPYALLAAIASAFGYLIIGMTEQLWLALPAVLIIPIIALLIAKAKNRKKVEHTV